jgi:hypothetical protein
MTELGGTLRQAALAAMTGTLIALTTVLPARATVFTNTLTGTLLFGSDNAGLFGAPNTDLTGAPFSIVYTFDTSLGDYAANPPVGLSGSIESLVRQTAPSPSPISTLLTINGQSFVIAGIRDFFLPAENNATYLATFNSLTLQDGQVDVFNQDFFRLNASGNICRVNCVTQVDNFISTSVAFELPLEIFQSPFPSLSSITFQGPATGTGTFLFENLPIIQNNLFGDPDVQAAGRFNIETFAVSEVQEIPEPASWTLFLLGIAALGFRAFWTRRLLSGTPQCLLLALSRP